MSRKKLERPTNNATLAAIYDEAQRRIGVADERLNAFAKDTRRMDGYQTILFEAPSAVPAAAAKEVWTGVLNLIEAYFDPDEIVVTIRKSAEEFEGRMAEPYATMNPVRVGVLRYQFEARKEAESAILGLIVENHAKEAA